jgi:hypothetical protein
MVEQQLVDGQWIFVGPAYTCPQTEGPIGLAPGDSIMSNWFFAPGTRRLAVGVGGTVDMSDQSLDTSAAFEVHE